MSLYRLVTRLIISIGKSFAQPFAAANTSVPENLKRMEGRRSGREDKSVEGNGKQTFLSPTIETQGQQRFAQIHVYFTTGNITIALGKFSTRTERKFRQDSIPLSSQRLSSRTATRDARRARRENRRSAPRASTAIFNDLKLKLNTKKKRKNVNAIGKV